MGFRMPDNLFDDVYASLWRPYEPYGPTFFSLRLNRKMNSFGFPPFFCFLCKKEIGYESGCFN